MSNDSTRNIAQGLGDLLVTDLFNRHGITTDKAKIMSEAQKAQIRELVADLQQQVNQFINQNNTPTLINPHSFQAPQTSQGPQTPQAASTTPSSSTSTAPRKRLRLQKLSPQDVSDLISKLDK